MPIRRKRDTMTAVFPSETMRDALARIVSTHMPKQNDFTRGEHRASDGVMMYEIHIKHLTTVSRSKINFMIETLNAVYIAGERHI